MSRGGAFAGIKPGGGGLQFTLFGFPTRVQASFFVVAVFLGLFPGATVATVAIWTAVVGVSIMFHELGHAFAARRLGAEPTIDLYSFGGLTHWRPRPDASRWEMISVAVAGPAAGLVLGGVVAAAAAVAGPIETDNLRFFVVVVLWVNLGWGLVNLLPVLPLDGGHILAELLPGEREQRWRRAAIVSVITGSVAAVVLIAIGYIWGALVFGWAIATNVTALRAPAQQQKARDLDAEVRLTLDRIGQRDPGAIDDAVRVATRLGPRGPAFKAVAIEAAAAGGDGRGARDLLERVPGTVPPAIYALVSVTESGGLSGVNELIEIFERAPDAYHGRWLAIGLHRAGRIDDLLPLVHGVPSPSRTPDLISSVASLAEWAGRQDVALGLRSLAVG